MDELLKNRFAFTQMMMEKYAGEFDLLSRLLEFAVSVTKTEIRSPNDPHKFFREILLAAQARTVNRLQSIRFLLLLGNSSDAAIILRSIFEDRVHLFYIETDPVLRSYLYLRDGSIHRAEVMRRGAATANEVRTRREYEEKASYFEEERRLFESDIRSLTSANFKFPPRGRWAKRTLRDIAESVGLKSDYEIVYSDLSSRSHCSAGNAHEFLIFREDENAFIPQFYPTDNDLQLITWTAVYYALDILKCNDRNRDLGTLRQIHQLEHNLQDLMARDVKPQY